jgi:protein-arginine kinase activator protein McsA
MSVEELNEARAQAVSNQEFEYAAALRDAIQRKKEKKA